MVIDFGPILAGAGAPVDPSCGTRAAGVAQPTTRTTSTTNERQSAGDRHLTLPPETAEFADLLHPSGDWLRIARSGGEG